MKKRTAMPPVVIYGASRQGGVALSILRAGRTRVRGFVDDGKAAPGEPQADTPLLGGWDWITANQGKGLGILVAIGSNEVRVRLGEKLRSGGWTLINAVHPSAVVMDRVRLGTGIMICAGAVIVRGSKIENDAVINTGSTIDHDSLVEAGGYVSPGVHTAGCVTIGRGAFVGVGAVLGPGVAIGRGSVVGAGSVVLDDVPDGVFAYGAPARVVRPVPDPLDWRRILSGKRSL
jgi:UDP-N-acetylbacillosamine N-acetyltransferase